MKKKILQDIINHQNSKKKLFTPGPASLLKENLSSMQPCFGTGDQIYVRLENKVLNKLKSFSGHKNIARLQGSSSLALEILVNNFFYGKILIISTGYYSDRLNLLCNQQKKNFGNIKKISIINWKNIKNIQSKFDWIFACPTETSVGLKLPIRELFKLKKRLKSKLALDATASIGLESDLNLADVIAYSSCKGLFGLTGASFIAFNPNPFNEVNSFYLNIKSHLEKKMTGPYHTIASLADVLPIHDDIKYSVKVNKLKFIERLKPYVSSMANEPLLCTHIKQKVSSTDKKVILYKTRGKVEGSVVCHLGEVHLKRKAKGEILNTLKFTK